MVVFGVAAQVLDTILIKATSATVEAVCSFVLWGGKSAIRWYWPQTITEISEADRLRLELNSIKKELDELKQKENVINI